MFTGIIEDTGVITKISSKKKNKVFWIQSSLFQELKVDQSLSHNGVCLTVEEIIGDVHKVTAVAETLKKTNLNGWKVGDLINLERCLQMNGRLDGHLVQGHVDAAGICKTRKEKGGSWEYSFEFPKRFGHLIIEKGSVCLNGISLTAFNVKKKTFSVAIIPYTYEHTNINQVFPSSLVNLEFDIVGKYILKNSRHNK
jgi:riboflavin synthase